MESASSSPQVSDKPERNEFEAVFQVWKIEYSDASFRINSIFLNSKTKHKNNECV